MKLEAKKYKFKYYHGAICPICGCEIMKEHESESVLHVYEIPSSIKSLISEHFKFHYGDFDYLTDLYGNPSEKCGKLEDDSYYVRIESENAFQKCLSDIKSIYDSIENRNAKPCSEQDITDLKRLISNCSFSDCQKQELFARISELDELSFSRRKELFAQEEVKASQSAYSTHRMGIPGLGKRS